MHDGPRTGTSGEGTADRRDAPHGSQRRIAPVWSATSRLPSPRPADASAKVEEHLVSLLFPATFEAEQYRALRHVLEQHRAVSGLAVVAITSASVGDGKTTTAINLAGALAQASGARVLLIDADLRRPSIAEHLGLVGPAHVERPGLLDVLTDSRFRLEDVVESRPEFNLSVIPAGLPPRAPYEVLQSARFMELIEEARHEYDYVILDTPPLVAVPDGRLIIKSVDGFVLVVRAHKTPRKLVDEALGLSDPQKFLGLVFNSDDRPLTGYYRGYHTSHPLSLNGSRTGRFGRILRSGRRNGTV
jgi:capsular exopolysaccharide synthesis family protein